MRRLKVTVLILLISHCTGITATPGWGGQSNGHVARLSSVSLPVQETASQPGASGSIREENSLVPGKSIERELSGGQSHSYKIMLTSGQYLQIIVEQRGMDVGVAIFTPQGKKFSEVNSDHTIEGSETAAAIAEDTGEYLIEVRSPDKTARIGRYQIKLEALRVATTEDKDRVVAGSIFREAEQLHYGTLEAKRKSIEKYNEALELFRKAKDGKSQVETLRNIGDVYYILGDRQNALAKLNEALPVSKAIGDRKLEADVINNIGLVYWTLGENRKALEHLNQALTINQAVGDRNGQGVTLNNLGLVYRSLGEMQKALENLNQSLSIRKAVGDRKEEAITLNNLGLVHQSLGETEKALARYNESLSI